MIACLMVEPYLPTGLLDRLKGRLLGPQVSVRETHLHQSSYRLLELSRCADVSAAWPHIEDALPSDTSCLLCPAEITPPDWLSPPDPGPFERELLLQTATALIAQSKIPPARRVVGLYDPAGVHSGLLPHLLSAFSLAQVRTNHPARYQEAADRMLGELGAPVLVSETASFGECALLLIPPGEEPFPAPCPTLSMKPGAGRFVLSEPRMANLTPPAGIDPHQFASALFALDPSRAIHPVAASLSLGGTRIPLAQASARLDRAVMGHSA